MFLASFRIVVGEFSASSWRARVVGRVRLASYGRVVRVVGRIVGRIAGVGRVWGELLGELLGELGESLSELASCWTSWVTF